MTSGLVIVVASMTLPNKRDHAGIPQPVINAERNPNHM
jgi:hypothetical protein